LPLRYNVAAAIAALGRIERTAAAGKPPRNRRPIMTGHNSRFTKLSLTLLCVGALGACSGDRTASDTAAARTDSAAGRLDSAANARTDSAGAAMSGAWSNDRFFGYTHNADNGEIALGKLASTKATNAEVKAFARQMVTDHQAMMTEMHGLAGKLNAKMDSTWDDAKSIGDDGRDKLRDLTDKEAGADWDKNYIENQIDVHQRVLGKLTDAVKNNTDKSVTDALTKASAKVQEHLTKAESINSKLKG
jgi:putative membrane protein